MRKLACRCMGPGLVPRAPYRALTRKDFDDVVEFVATGGYALKSYERFAKIRQGQDGTWRLIATQSAAPALLAHWIL